VPHTCFIFLLLRRGTDSYYSMKLRIRSEPRPMKPPPKAVGILLVILALAGIIVGWHYLHRPPKFQSTTTTSGDTVTQQVNSFDEFQDSLAQRVLTRLGAENLTAIVAIADYPVGTLMGAKGSVPADFNDCLPPATPKPFEAGRLFPAYTLSSNTALTANLGSRAIDGLDSAGVELKQGSKVQYSIEQVQIQILDDKSVEELVSTGNCGKYIADHTGTRLIRGLVTGRVTFTVAVSDPASVQAKLAKIGNLNISDNPDSSTISVSDATSEPIVELLSEFTLRGLASGRSPTPKPVEQAAAPAAPAVAASPPVQVHIFIQQDVNSPAQDGQNAVQTLRQDWPKANVESKVELIPTRKMPDTPQVRYFNAGDAGLAEKCLGMLQGKYPTMRVVRVGLSSPQGQLEVWLPKAAS
jgi:hypothetical protein